MLQLLHSFLVAL